MGMRYERSLSGRSTATAQGNKPAGRKMLLPSSDRPSPPVPRLREAVVAVDLRFLTRSPVRAWERPDAN